MRMATLTVVDVARVSGLLFTPRTLIEKRNVECLTRAVVITTLGGGVAQGGAGVAIRAASWARDARVARNASRNLGSGGVRRDLRAGAAGFDQRTETRRRRRIQRGPRAGRPV